MVELQTNHGNIRIELDTEHAPKSSENFLAYVRSGHFDGTVFHRVIDGFMIQGGGFEPGMKQKPTLAPIQNEANNGLKNDRYTLAMARTSDPHSATAQFFINVADNAFLNHTAPTAQGWGYAVFGKVVEGTRRGGQDQECENRPQGLSRRRAARRRGHPQSRRSLTTASPQNQGGGSRVG
jgi:Peptidyl-prolyl cis-trans isomerase (rotamase) - cyclophilin family